MTGYFYRIFCFCGIILGVILFFSCSPVNAQTNGYSYLKDRDTSIKSPDDHDEEEPLLTSTEFHLIPENPVMLGRAIDVITKASKMDGGAEGKTRGADFLPMKRPSGSDTKYFTIMMYRNIKASKDSGQNSWFEKFDAVPKLNMKVKNKFFLIYDYGQDLASPMTRCGDPCEAELRVVKYHLIAKKIVIDSVFDDLLKMHGGDSSGDIYPIKFKHGGFGFATIGWTPYRDQIVRGRHVFKISKDAILEVPELQKFDFGIGK